MNPSPFAFPLLAQDAPPPAADGPPPAADVQAGGGAAVTVDPNTGEPLGGTGNSAPPPSPFGGGFMLLLVGMMLLMIVFSISSGRKEKKRKAEMLASLAKGSKVQTVGGVLGTVVEVRDGEVVVKVDENSNTRMRFAKSAVNAVLES